MVDKRKMTYFSGNRHPANLDHG